MTNQLSDSSLFAGVTTAAPLSSSENVNWNEFGIAAAPFTTITGPTLDVTATKNYAGDTINNVTAITFDTAAASTATFSATQFGGGAIASTATITGDSHSDTMYVHVASGGAFDGSQLQFSGWSASDKFDIAAAGDHETITGTSANDIINMGAYFDTTDAINGGTGDATLDLSGNYSLTTTVTSVMLQNVSKIVLAAANSYSFDFDTGVVAAWHTVTIGAGAVATGENLTLNLAGDTQGSYVVDLGTGANRITLNDQADTVVCSTGTNFIYANSVMDTHDKIEGAGTFTDLFLDANYSAGYTFGASEISNITDLFLNGNFSYNLTIGSADIAEPGRSFNIDASGLGVGDSFTFNGSHETSIGFDINAGAGLDKLTGDAANDSFNFYGTDMLTAADRINGGGGYNYIYLTGDYSAGLTLENGTIKNIQAIDLAPGDSYKLVLAAGNVVSGETFNMDGANLGATDSLDFNGSKVTAGILDIDGGAGNDTLIGGSVTNNFDGGGGADTMTCGSGVNTFSYFAISDSESTSHDNIIGFNALTDSFQLHLAGSAPNAIDPTVTSGTLSSAHFDAGLTAALGANQLHADDAVLFTPTAGNLEGHAFLVIDENGVAGYQAGADLVIELTNATNLSHFSLSNFT